MKKAIIAVALLQACLTVNATTITVEGVGVDRESAKRDAFRTAIENVCGTAVLSDREHFNNRTTHNKVTSYSSCRVEKYEIHEYRDNKLKVTVTVKDNRMADRLYSQSSSNRFDGDILRAQIETLKQEQKSGDELIDAIFRDYPYRAYNLQKTQEPYITVDNRRNLYLMVPYDITWNYKFISAMNDMFHLVETPRGRGTIMVMAKDPEKLLLGHRDKYFMDDMYRLEYIKTKFVNQNELRLNVKARDYKGNNVLNICYNPEYKAGGIFYSVGVNNKITIFGNDRNSGTMRIKLTFPADVIYDIYVDVVAARDCKL
jgi:hypothetical protein